MRTRVVAAPSRGHYGGAASAMGRIVRPQQGGLWEQKGSEGSGARSMTLSFERSLLIGTLNKKRSMVTVLHYDGEGCQLSQPLTPQSGSEGAPP